MKAVQSLGYKLRCEATHLSQLVVVPLHPPTSSPPKPLRAGLGACGWTGFFRGVGVTCPSPQGLSKGRGRSILVQDSQLWLLLSEICPEQLSRVRIHSSPAPLSALFYAQGSAN